jgi:hypothetical protein
MPVAGTLDLALGVVMKALHILRNHPVILGSILLVAFAGWLAHDAMPREQASLPSDEPQPRLVQVPKRLPQPPFPLPLRDPSRPSVVTPDMITQLQPGMARVEVEELIGLPPAGLVHPVSNVEGRLTYRASYLANLEPSRALPPGAAPLNPAPRSLIGLEYDASRTGHPLLKVHIPDPMS